MRHYCVTGGGAFATVFNRAGVELIGTNARGYRLGGIPEGFAEPRLIKAYAKAPLRAAGHGLFVSATGIVYVIRNDRVAAEALADALAARLRLDPARHVPR